MIKIQEVDNKQYGFPTIDFKFHNTSQEVAILWQFAIEVLHAEADLTPALEFDFAGDSDRYEPEGSLFILGVNYGWGPASSCVIALNNPILNHFYSEDLRRFIGDIESGQQVLLFRLGRPEVSTQEFARVQSLLRNADLAKMERDLSDNHYVGYEKIRRRELEDRWRCRKFEHWKEQSEGERSIPAIPIDDLILNWKCLDAKGRTLEGEEKGLARRWDLFLTSAGFRYSKKLLMGSMQRSDSTYCAILDPACGAHERKYSVSRTIAPGEAERFHILVGATKSSSINLRFKFWVGTDGIITSEEFTIHILNPHQSRLNDLYKDGDHLVRENASKRTNRLSEYPFLSQHRRRGW